MLRSDPLTHRAAGQFGRRAGRFPVISYFFADTPLRTNKCRRDRHQKAARFSARCSACRISYLLAESGLRLRERKKRSEIGGRRRTFSDLPRRHRFGASVNVTERRGFT
jgi:hypothetical protein